MKRFQKVFKKLTSNPKTKYVFGAIVICAMIAILLSMKKTLIVDIDGKEQVFTTYKGTISSVLEEHNIKIGNKDKVSPDINTKLGAENKVSIHRAVPVTVKVDGKIITFNSAEETVADMLAVEGIEVASEDKVEPKLETALDKDLKVNIVRVDSKIVKETKDIDFETVIKNDDELDKGKTKTVTEGKKGSKETTYEVVYEDGKQVSKTKVSEKVTKKPVDKVVKKGTAVRVEASKNDSTGVVSRGDSNGYKKKYNMVATAYSIHGLTASGNRTVRDKNGLSTIAVDPRVIPLGTIVYIPGYGKAIAHDTGSAIKNYKIDLFMNTSREAMNWGVRNVEVYIISYPGKK